MTQPLMSHPLALDFVSPLPPTRSGIADYSRDLLPRLEPLCDLRVVRLPGLPIAEEIEARWRPAPIEELGRGGRLPLYQMGNNRHHMEIWRLAHEIPGVLTLHDVALHHLLIELTLAEDDHRGYLERLEADHGWWGRAAAGARRYLDSRPSTLFGLPVHRTLLRRQRGILVHSRWAAQTVRESEPGIAVRVVPMGVPLADPIGAEAGIAWRREKGIPESAGLIGSFGFQTPIKRTDRAIEALADEALAGVHLAVGGAMSEGLGLERLAAEAGVAERVHFLGFLDYEDYERAMGACDVCLNLRYPTAGETSASLLRELSVGRPAIVSDYAQFAELPEDVALKVPLGEGEVAALAATVGGLLARPERLAEMSESARRFIAERHAPERAAEAVVDACAELRALEPPGDRRFEAPRPSSLVWHDLPGRLAVEGAEPPWPEGEERRLRLELSNDGFAHWLSAASDPGGVMIEVQWRGNPAGEPSTRQWLELPRDLPPDRSMALEISVRRPLEEARVLVVEPHLKGVGGFNAVGGPSWTMRLE